MTDSFSTAQTGTRSVTAFFDTSEHATIAKNDLVAAGVPATSITIVGSNADNFTATEDQHQGFWESLTNFFMPEDDRRVYSEGLRRGGFALSVRTTEALYDKAIDVLDRDGAVDLDEREVAWESEGWSRAGGGVDNLAADTTPYKPSDASTAGFGGSYAGEDGLAMQASQPGLISVVPTPFEGAPVTEAENPDVRERIGAGTASQTAPASTGGPQTYANPATPATDAAVDAITGRSPQDPAVRRDLDHGRSRVRSFIVEGDVNR